MGNNKNPGSEATGPNHIAGGSDKPQDAFSGSTVKQPDPKTIVEKVNKDQGVDAERANTSMRDPASNNPRDNIDNPNNHLDSLAKKDGQLVEGTLKPRLPDFVDTTNPVPMEIMSADYHPNEVADNTNNAAPVSNENTDGKQDDMMSHPEKQIDVEVKKSEEEKKLKQEAEEARQKWLKNALDERIKSGTVTAQDKQQILDVKVSKIDPLDHKRFLEAMQKFMKQEEVYEDKDYEPSGGENWTQQDSEAYRNVINAYGGTAHEAPEPSDFTYEFMEKFLPVYEGTASNNENWGKSFEDRKKETEDKYRRQATARYSNDVEEDEEVEEDDGNGNKRKVKKKSKKK